MTVPSIARSLGPSLAALGLAASLAGCHPAAVKHDARATRPPIPVTVVSVRRQVVARPLQLSGSVIAENQVSVVPKTTGRIVELAVDEGYRVKAGQTVAILNTPQLGLEVQQQQSAVVTAQANRDQAADNLKRMLDLAGQGVVSDQQLQQARIQSRVAQSQLKEARAALALTQTNLDDRVVTSPVSGVVVEKVQDVGAMASPGSPIVVIASGAYQAKLSFAEHDLPSIYTGLHLTLSAAGLPGQQFRGIVSEISEMVDPQTRLLSCKVNLAHHGMLKIGMNVRGLVTASPHEALVVPTDALLNDGGQTIVYAFRAGRAREVPVTVGVRNAELTEITSGLSPGDQVIEKGNAFLHDGDPVALAQAAAGPAASPSAVPAVPTSMPATTEPSTTRIPLGQNASEGPAHVSS